MLTRNLIIFGSGQTSVYRNIHVYRQKMHFSPYDGNSLRYNGHDIYNSSRHGIRRRLNLTSWCLVNTCLCILIRLKVRLNQRQYIGTHAHHIYMKILIRFTIYSPYGGLPVKRLKSFSKQREKKTKKQKKQCKTK